MAYQTYVLDRLIGIIICIITLPVVLLLGIVLVASGVRPILIRTNCTENNQLAQFVIFNFKKSTRFHKFILKTCVDLIPCFYNVVHGSINLSEALGLFTELSEKRIGKDKSKAFYVLTIWVAILIALLLILFSSCHINPAIK